MNWFKIATKAVFSLIGLAMLGLMYLITNSFEWTILAGLSWIMADVAWLEYAAQREEEEDD